MLAAAQVEKEIMIQSTPLGSLRSLSPISQWKAQAAPRPLADNDPLDGFHSHSAGQGDGDGPNWGTVAALVVGAGAVAGIGYVTYTASQTPQPPVVQQVQVRTPAAATPLSQQVHAAPRVTRSQTSQPAPSANRTTFGSDGVVTVPLGDHTTLDTEGRIESKISEHTSIRSDGTVNVQVSPNVSIRSDGYRRKYAFALRVYRRMMPRRARRPLTMPCHRLEGTATSR